MEILIALGQFIINHAPELVGIILPPVVDYFNKDVHTDEERYIVTLLICFCIAILYHWNELIYGSPQDLLVSFSIIALEAQTVFKLYFKNSFVRRKINEVIIEPQNVIETPSSRI